MRYYRRGGRHGRGGRYYRGPHRPYGYRGNRTRVTCGTLVGIAIFATIVVGALILFL